MVGGRKDCWTSRSIETSLKVWRSWQNEALPSTCATVALADVDDAHPSRCCCHLLHRATDQESGTLLISRLVWFADHHLSRPGLQKTEAQNGRSREPLYRICKATLQQRQLHRSAAGRVVGCERARSLGCHIEAGTRQGQ